MFISQKLKPGKWAELPGGANTANGVQRVGVGPVLLPGLSTGLRDVRKDGGELQGQGWGSVALPFLAIPA